MEPGELNIVLEWKTGTPDKPVLGTRTVLPASGGFGLKEH
jgi:hypothetical protein